MNHTVARLATVSSAICLGSWIALAATAGNVGLQRSISRGALTLFEQPQVIAVGFLAFGLAFAGARLFQVGAVELLVGVLVGDLLAGLILAPLAIGELEPIHAPLVIGAVSLAGVQPLAAFAGAWLAATRVRETHAL